MQTKLHYKIIGEGRPLIALHGFYVDHRLMTGCLEPVFKKNTNTGWKRIYIDLPGMGNSPGNIEQASSDCILESLLEFIEQIAPKEHIVLAGESYGGYLARAIAQIKNTTTDGLLMVCPLVIADINKRSLPARKVLEQDEELLKELSHEDAIHFQSCNTIQTRETWLRFKKEILPGLKLGNKEFQQIVRTCAYQLTDEEKIFARPFTKPTLLFAGRQDSIVGYNNAWAILENYPRMTFAVLDSASHNLQIEQKKVFAALVEEWLERIKR